MKKKIIYFCILAIFIAGLFFIGWQVYESKINSKTLKTGNTEKLDVQKIADAIKKVESENPPRIGKSPTDEEINNSPYVKHIRIALNGYLDGTNNGVEKMALSTTEGMNCGLNNFDKAYYQSKFIIYDASDDDYGGVQADIVFINKPDA
ncbi:MAG: hypothetical protein NT094_04965, partial [Candidatus Staskawiczbacteria bacterium]|nr:hypothetical protein [Candidatus Staskawiczbacteria bacterium]